MLDGGAPHGQALLLEVASHPCALRRGHRGCSWRAPKSITSPFSQIGVWAVGGAVSGVDPDATAVGEREVGFEINIAAAWPPSDPDGQRHIAWVREGGRRCARTA